MLARKFSKDPEELSRIAVTLAGIGELVRPAQRLKVFNDDPDNRILECAIAGKAEAIVTGDKAMLRLKKYKDMKFITLSEFLS